MSFAQPISRSQEGSTLSLRLPFPERASQIYSGLASSTMASPECASSDSFTANSPIFAAADVCLRPDSGSESPSSAAASLNSGDELSPTSQQQLAGHAARKVNLSEKTNCFFKPQMGRKSAAFLTDGNRSLAKDEAFLLYVAILSLYQDGVRPTFSEVRHKIKELGGSSSLEQNFTSLYLAQPALYTVTLAPESEAKAGFSDGIRTASCGHARKHSKLWRVLGPNGVDFLTSSKPSLHPNNVLSPEHQLSTSVDLGGFSPLDGTTTYIPVSPADTVIYIRKTPTWFRGWVSPRDSRNRQGIFTWSALLSFLLSMNSSKTNPSVMSQSDPPFRPQAESRIRDFPVSVHLDSETPGRTRAEQFKGTRYGLAKLIKASGPLVLRQKRLGDLCHLIQLAICRGFLGYEYGSIQPAWTSNVTTSLVFASCANLILKPTDSANTKALVSFLSSGHSQSGLNTTQPVTQPPLTNMDPNPGDGAHPQPDWNQGASGKVWNPTFPLFEQSPSSVTTEDGQLQGLEHLQTLLRQLLMEAPSQTICLSRMRFMFQKRFNATLNPSVFGFAKLSDVLIEKCWGVCRLYRHKGRHVVVRSLEAATQGLPFIIDGDGIGKHSHLVEDHDVLELLAPCFSSHLPGPMSPSPKEPDSDNSTTPPTPVDVATDFEHHHTLQVVESKRNLHNLTTQVLPSPNSDSALRELEELVRVSFLNHSSISFAFLKLHQVSRSGGDTRDLLDVMTARRFARPALGRDAAAGAQITWDDVTACLLARDNEMAPSVFPKDVDYETAFELTERLNSRQDDRINVSSKFLVSICESLVAHLQNLFFARRLPFTGIEEKFDEAKSNGLTDEDTPRSWAAEAEDEIVYEAVRASVMALGEANYRDLESEDSDVNRSWLGYQQSERAAGCVPMPEPHELAFCVFDIREDWS